MLLTLERLVDVPGEFVARRGLPREPARKIMEVVQRVRRRPVTIVGAGSVCAVFQISPGGEIPEAVLENRTSEGGRRLDHVVETIGIRKALGLQLRRDVTALPRVPRAAEIEITLERVAAIARNHVDAHATARGVGSDGARLVRHVLHHREVVVPRLAGAVGVAEVETVDLYDVLERRLAPGAQVRALACIDAAQIGPRRFDSRHNDAGGKVRACARKSIERVARQHLPLRRLLNIDDRRRNT